MKKLLVLFFALALVLSLIACEKPNATGSSQNTSGNNNATTGQSSLETSQQAVSQPTVLPNSQTANITEAQAKQIALSHAKVTEADDSRLTVEYDKNDGVASYEIEFFVGKDEYDYDIDAKTGAILKAEKERVD